MSRPTEEEQAAVDRAGDEDHYLTSWLEAEDEHLIRGEN